MHINQPSTPVLTNTIFCFWLIHGSVSLFWMKIWNNFLCWHHVKTPPIKILTECQHDICIMKIINSETIPTNTDPLVYQRNLEEVATTWTMKNQNDDRNWNGYDVTTIWNQHWQIHFLLTDGWWCGWGPKILLWCYDDDHYVNDFINQRQSRDQK